MPAKSKLPEGWTPELLSKAKAITAKRARTVITHILANGQITSDDIQNLYHYRHTSRAIRDVRELGIPITTASVRSADGRTISSYRFGNPKDARGGKWSGRSAFPKAFKSEIATTDGMRCHVCLARLAERYLQVDHRVPFEIAGEPELDALDPADYMLLDGSCNRAKSWSCEHCPNWVAKNPATCKSCYWANPQTYSHVATEEMRRLDLVWTAEETAEYDQAASRAAKGGLPMPEFVKLAIRVSLARRNSQTES